MTAIATRGLREHVTQVSHGAVIMMIGVQEALDDLVGGVQAQQWGMVLAQTRYTVMACLHVRGLAHGAEPYVYEDGGAFDPCSHVPAAELETGWRLIHEARTLASDPSGAPAWLDRVRGWVEVSEATLGLGERLPELRSPEGMFGALRLARGWHDLVAELGLPPLLPSEWTNPL